MAVSRHTGLLPAFSRPGMRLAVLEGCFATLPQTFTTGIFLTGFALMLGAGPWALGLLGAVPALGQAGQLLTPALMNRGVSRKTLTVWGASVSRYLFLLIAVIPFLPIGLNEKLTLFFALLAMSTVSGQMAGVSWCDWIADLVPDAERGRYLGLRNGICAGVGMAAVWGGSRFLDAFKGHDERWAFVALIALGVAGALASQWALGRQPDAEATGRPRKRVSFRAPLANRNFMRLTGLMLVWTVCVGLTAPFCLAYALETVHVDYTTLGVHATLIGGLSILTQPLWGRLIDKKGAQFTQLVAMAPICLHPLYWLAMRPDFVTPLWFDAVSSGIFWSGLNLATMSLLMEASPSGERASYMSLFNTCTGVAASLSALVGGALLTAFAGQSLMVAGAAFSAFQVLLACVCVGRVLSLLSLAGLPAVKVPTLTLDTWEAVSVQPAAEDTPRAAKA